MKYIYYCDNCNKVYKVAGEGRKVKCTNCHHGLRDLLISEEDYLVLDRSMRERLKHKPEEEKKKRYEYPLENELNAYDTPVLKEAAKENAINKEKLIKNSKKIEALAGQTKSIHAAINNTYLRTQIQSQILATENFLSICRLSAMKDDGRIDKDERKAIKNLEKITNNFQKELRKML